MYMYIRLLVIFAIPRILIVITKYLINNSLISRRSPFKITTFLSIFQLIITTLYVYSTFKAYDDFVLAFQLSLGLTLTCYCFLYYMVCHIITLATNDFVLRNGEDWYPEITYVTDTLFIFIMAFVLRYSRILFFIYLSISVCIHYFVLDYYLLTSEMDHVLLTFGFLLAVIHVVFLLVFKIWVKCSCCKLDIFEPDIEKRLVYRISEIILKKRIMICQHCRSVYILDKNVKLTDAENISKKFWIKHHGREDKLSA